MKLLLLFTSLFFFFITFYPQSYASIPFHEDLSIPSLNHNDYDTHTPIIATVTSENTATTPILDIGLSFSSSASASTLQTISFSTNTIIDAFTEIVLGHSLDTQNDCNWIGPAMLSKNYPNLFSETILFHPISFGLTDCVQFSTSTFASRKDPQPMPIRVENHPTDSCQIKFLPYIPIQTDITVSCWVTILPYQLLQSPAQMRLISPSNFILKHQTTIPAINSKIQYPRVHYNVIDPGWSYDNRTTRNDLVQLDITGIPTGGLAAGSFIPIASIVYKSTLVPSSVSSTAEKSNFLELRNLDQDTLNNNDSIQDDPDGDLIGLVPTDVAEYISHVANARPEFHCDSNTRLVSYNSVLYLYRGLNSHTSHVPHESCYFYLNIASRYPSFYPKYNLGSWHGKEIVFGTPISRTVAGGEWNTFNVKQWTQLWGSMSRDVNQDQSERIFSAKMNGVGLSNSFTSFPSQKSGFNSVPFRFVGMYGFGTRAIENSFYDHFFTGQITYWNFTSQQEPPQTFNLSDLTEASNYQIDLQYLTSPTVSIALQWSMPLEMAQIWDQPFVIVFSLDNHLISFEWTHLFHFLSTMQSYNDESMKISHVVKSFIPSMLANAITNFGTHYIAPHPSKRIAPEQSALPYSPGTSATSFQLSEKTSLLRRLSRKDTPLFNNCKLNFIQFQNSQSFNIISRIPFPDGIDGKQQWELLSGKNNRFSFIGDDLASYHILQGIPLPKLPTDGLELTCETFVRPLLSKPPVDRSFHIEVDLYSNLQTRVATGIWAYSLTYRPINPETLQIDYTQSIPTSLLSVINHNHNQTQTQDLELLSLSSTNNSPSPITIGSTTYYPVDSRGSWSNTFDITTYIEFSITCSGSTSSYAHLRSLLERSVYILKNAKVYDSNKRKLIPTDFFQGITLDDLFYANKGLAYLSGYKHYPQSYTPFDTSGSCRGSKYIPFSASDPFDKHSCSNKDVGTISSPSSTVYIELSIPISRIRDFSSTFFHTIKFQPYLGTILTPDFSALKESSPIGPRVSLYERMVNQYVFPTPVMGECTRNCDCNEVIAQCLDGLCRPHGHFGAKPQQISELLSVQKYIKDIYPYSPHYYDNHWYDGWLGVLVWTCILFTASIFICSICVFAYRWGFCHPRSYNQPSSDSYTKLD